MLHNGGGKHVHVHAGSVLVGQQKGHTGGGECVLCLLAGLALHP